MVKFIYNGRIAIRPKFQRRNANYIMEESNHPLGMTVLEVQDTVVGYESLNEEVIRKLMAAEDLCTLPPSLQRRVLGQMITVPSSLVAEVSGAAILVTNQWVVSIHGDSLVHCVAALVKYRNAVATQLAATVTGEVQTPVAENTGPLQEMVTRRETLRDKRRRLREYVKAAGWAFASAVAGALLGVLGTVLLGG